MKINKSSMYFLKFARRVYIESERILNRTKTSELQVDFFDQIASDLIKNKLTVDKPCMISRLGTSELNTVITYLNMTRESKFPCEKCINYVRGNIDKFWWDKSIISGLRNNAGFFPITEKLLEDFSNRIINDTSSIDVLGSWIKEEIEVLKFMKNTSTVRLKDLEPYYHANPWSEALAGKVVLVIHPFEDSIQLQYQKRKLLFKDQRILPEFELKTLRSIQSIAGNNTEFSTWFEALDWMCEKIADIDFDIALVGAGAYGLPLAAYIKRIGKKSVHLGGAIQILFGIKGKRWDNQPFFQKLYNEHWVRPLGSEMPNRYQSIEGGCYW